MIDYNVIAQSIDYYSNSGFQRIETPWTVSAAIDDITRPADRIHMQLKHNDKCLVASGEQSFLYLYCKDFLPKGKYQTVTPCFRYEAFDGMHTKTFIKNELIITDEVTVDKLSEMIDIAKGFFEQYLPVKVECISDDPNSPSYDIVSLNGHELGSYGIRHCEYLNWIYGTGVAEPRLSRVLQSLKNN